MRFNLTWAVALIFALVVLPVRASDWAIDVVPSDSGKEKKMISIYSPFCVVLTNVTDHNLIIWKEWCSWGYFNLTFEFTGKDGQAVQVRKKDRNWSKNFPAPYVVEAGKHFVLVVNLKEDWQGTEKLDGPMTMKAIYKNTNEAFPGEKPNPQNKIPDDMQKLIDTAWVGQVESEPMQVTIAR
jgi:hypothetical protein